MEAERKRTHSPSPLRCVHIFGFGGSFTQEPPKWFSDCLYLYLSRARARTSSADFCVLASDEMIAFLCYGGGGDFDGIAAACCCCPCALRAEALKFKVVVAVDNVRTRVMMMMIKRTIFILQLPPV